MELASGPKHVERTFSSAMPAFTPACLRGCPSLIVRSSLNSLVRPRPGPFASWVRNVTHVLLGSDAGFIFAIGEQVIGYLADSWLPTNGLDILCATPRASEVRAAAAPGASDD